MNQQNSSLRFDHKEIAVIFSLFIFVSLLMFTVGILVGKGLTQARYEGALDTKRLSPPELSDIKKTEEARLPASSGTSVSTDVPPKSVAENDVSSEVTAAPEAQKQEGPLKLIPQKPRLPDSYVGSLREPANTFEVDKLLKDSKIRALVEEEPRPGNHKPSKSAMKTPESASSGTFTVQVGSYTTERDATERVAALKKLGFPYAYFSVKELDDKKTKWYRVWLGYFSDYQAAKQSGDLLEQRGEVKNYLVRKSDTAG